MTDLIPESPYIKSHSISSLALRRSHSSKDEDLMDRDPHWQIMSLLTFCPKNTGFKLVSDTYEDRRTCASCQVSSLSFWGLISEVTNVDFHG